MPYTDLELAEVFIKTGELDDALAALERQLTNLPQDDHARRLRIEVLARMPDVASLTNALQDVNALAQQMPADFMLHSVILTKLGRDADALHALVQGCQTYPDDERLVEHHLQLLKKQGKIDQARGIVAAQIKIKGDSWRWLQWAGDLAVSAGDDRAAVAHYDSALTMIQSRYSVQTDQTARLLSDPAMSDAAAMTIPGVVARLLLTRADACLRLNRLDDADAGYQRAAMLIPNDPMIPFNRGLIALRRSDLDGAVGLCRPAWIAATPMLQEQMQRALQADSIYAPLAARLTL